jgi:hypothetical protein
MASLFLNVPSGKVHEMPEEALPAFVNKAVSGGFEIAIVDLLGCGMNLS